MVPDVNEITVRSGLETETANSGKVVNACQIVIRGEFTDRTMLFSGQNLFTPVQQQSPPTVGKRIAETSEDIVSGPSVLQPRIVVDVSTEIKIAVSTQPFVIELEGITVGSTK